MKKKPMLGLLVAGIVVLVAAFDIWCICVFPEFG